MRYGDLIQFEPIESVIQLLDANRSDEAKRLVSTYVISDEMAERINGRLIPQLSFDGDVDHKGLLVVGNYGTGKSHLMSVISLVAEDAGYVPLLRSPAVAKAAESIAGKFKVHRIEISSKMPLRDIVTRELEAFLEKHGVAYSFPPADQVVNNKAAFEAMMAAFHEKHPNQGVLLVVDEFLEYLRSRNDHALVLDLSFLREIGEVTKHLRFRFMAGVQEAIFDSARFQHVSDSLRRVKDRFAQILLARDDVSFVVAERLLKKTADQQNRIREYLTPFAKFFGNMNERMDQYVRLFPVHPDYIGTFERLVFTEKRGALVTLRDQIQAILQADVPTDRPGLISYDSFWDTVAANSVLRSDRDIGPVIKVSDVLASRIQQAFTRPAYRPMAQRLIKGLSVHRLTTGGDIYVAMGVTAQELRDSLALYRPGIDQMGGEPSEDLLSLVQTVLREILKTVNGQFISRTPDTEQFYLDLKKDIDYDAQVEKRADSLSEDALDRAYFSAVKALMELRDEATYVTGHQIWQYPIEWQERRVDRSGYLFFGAPNERPTAQPERDFYVYFVHPFDPPKFKDEHKSDEVFFRLKGLDEDIRGYLSTYAAALDLASTASGGAKTVYQDKAREALGRMSKWLQEKQLKALEMTYQGKSKSLEDWVKGISVRERARLGPEDRINFRDVVNVVSGLALSSRFAEGAPEYPTFLSLLTEQNRKQLITNALKMLAGGPKTKDATVILDALEMLDADKPAPAQSKYAKAVLAQLNAKGAGQVLNRSELLAGGPEVEYYAPAKFRLEPDLLVVVLGGLVYSGDIVLAIAGDKLDSSKTSLLVERSLDELRQFKHLEAPKEISTSVLKVLFELLGRSPGLAQMAAAGSDEPVKALQDAVSELVTRVLSASTDMSNRLVFWGSPLLREDELADWRKRLESLKDFVEKLSPFNTVGKLKNLRLTEENIQVQKPNLQVLQQVERLLNFVSDLGTTASYLSQAELVLPAEHDWFKAAQKTRKDVLDKLGTDRTAQKAAEYRQTLAKLKQQYVNDYIALHTKARLGVNDEKKQASLRKDARLGTLRSLGAISLMPTSQLTEFETKLGKLKGCAALIEGELGASPYCPHCRYQPRTEQCELVAAGTALKQLDDDLDQLQANWQQTLLENLDDPFTQDSLTLLPALSKKLIDAFLAAEKLPEPVTPEFVAAVQDALSGLEKITVKTDELRQALLQGGSPATPDELRKRFEALISERSKGKDASKLRFVVE
jgi:hypothetical protein